MQFFYLTFVFVAHYTIFLFISIQRKESSMEAPLGDENSNVTDHFENRRLSKRSVTFGFFSAGLFLPLPP